MHKDLLEYIEKNNKKRDKNLKYDFLPDLLEVIERPAHKAGSVIIWTVFALIVFVIIWASISKVEVVVSAQGMLQPVEDETILYSETHYKIENINVETGEKVKAGQVLVELGTDELDEEKEDIQHEIDNFSKVIEIYTKILNKEDISGVDVSEYDIDIQSDIRKLLEEYEENKTLIQQLTDSNLGSQAEEIDKTYRDSISNAMQELEVSKSKTNEMLEDINELIEKSTIVAPYDGIVYEVYISKKDMVVEKDMPIVSIIKEDAAFEMECYVSNKDIADIELNQKVNIKLDAYPYGDYGTVDGVVTFIAEKSEQKEGLGSVVAIKVQIVEDGFNEKVFSGLTGNADMIIDERRIIEYFIGPITDALKESIREK